jgi:uncharacterized repeat protein (TIGR03843 family)
MNLTKDRILHTLHNGKFELQGEFVWGSNYTFFVQIECEDQVYPAVYKPARGERPLWDFPTASLGKREVAAYIVSTALGWDLVPPTVYRKKGPLGAGSLQWFIAHDPNYHYFNFSDEDLQRLRPIVLFDLLINNADRKGSHIIKDDDHHLWLIDHGLSFHVEEKLRTVIWDFVGEPIPPCLCSDLAQFRQKLDVRPEERSALTAELLEYISLSEVRALARRADNLIDSNYFPAPDPTRRPFPWPQI